MKLDFKKLDFKRPLVIARSAQPPEPLDPTAALGYSCVACAKPLQVTRMGVKQIREMRGQPICNACGGIVIEAINDANLNPDAVEIRVNPHATWKGRIMDVRERDNDWRAALYDQVLRLGYRGPSGERRQYTLAQRARMVGKEYPHTARRMEAERGDASA